MPPSIISFFYTTCLLILSTAARKWSLDDFPNHSIEPGVSASSWPLLAFDFSLDNHMRELISLGVPRNASKMLQLSDLKAVDDLTGLAEMS